MTAYLAPLPSRSQRIASWLLLIGALVLLAAAMSMAVYEEHLYQAQRIDEVREQADILAATVTAALAFEDHAAAREYVRSTEVNPVLVAVGIYDQNGKLFDGFVRPGAHALPRWLHMGTDGANPLVTIAPVIEHGREIGAVYIRAISEPPTERAMRYAVLGALSVMGILVIAGLATAQASLSHANAALEERSTALAAANARLTDEMVERAKVEEALRQSQKMEAVGQLSGGIAHDFNNLLTIVMGNLQRAQFKIAEGRNDILRHVDAAMEGAQRAAALTQRILAFSRKQPLHPRPLDVNSVIDGMHELIRHSVRENIALQQQLGAGWQALCDRGQLENVILNLVINARDAMPEGGTLSLSTEDVHLQSRCGEAQPGDYVRIIVRDNGTGMAEEVKARALDPFFTTKPPGQGTGLGLSMIYGFVRQSGGDISIDTNPGLGTTITLLLPRVPSANEGPA